MTEEDRVRWDDRYTRLEPVPTGAIGPPSWLAPYEHELPTGGYAVDIACGRGAGAVWLAARGLDVWGLDVSAVAIDHARDLARRHGVGDRCRFEVVDLDGGLPAGPPASVVLCQRFRDRRLDAAMIERLVPGGLLAITALSEVDAEPGCFRVPPGELASAFAALDVIAAGEGAGVAWLLARV